MADINILMLGGKRCGKTTVLSSMCSEIDRALAGTELKFTPKNNTLANLAEAGSAIRQKIREFNNPLIRTTVDEKPTGAKQVYEFTYDMPGIKNIGINIFDIPGEWLSDDIHTDEVRNLISTSQVIIIAIDTPYLFYKMTDKGYGLYHEEYNKPKEIANFFKNSLSPEDIKDRMILFVPLKCERYYHLTYSKKLNPFRRNYMHEVFEAVCKGYNDLLFYLRSTEQLLNSLTIAVTPILSAGGIDFVKFITDPVTKRVTSLYQEPEYLPDTQKGYTPMFCEQPIIYALTYVMRLGIDGQWKQKGLFKSTQNANYVAMQTAYRTLSKKMKRGSSGNFAGDGYFIIQNPKNI